MGQTLELAFPMVQRAIPIAGSSQAFPVRRVYCVGRNYAAHVREMGGKEREPPFFFQKPADAVFANGGGVPYPPATKDFQHEVELVIAIGTSGANIRVEEAVKHVYGFAVGIDLTRRDLQIAARESGRPWEVGKAFDHSAPIGTLHKAEGSSVPSDARICLTVNGQLKQEGKIQDMIWSCDDIIAHLSALFTLEPGDLIFTGTPAGVGPLRVGDHVEAIIDGFDALEIDIVAPGSSL